MSPKPSLLREHDNDEPSSLLRRPPREPMTPGKVIAFATSVILTLGIASWVFNRTVTSFQSQLTAEITNVTYTDADGTVQMSKSEQANLLRQKAHEIDEKLLAKRAARLYTERSQPRRNANDVYNTWRNEIDELEHQLEGQRLIPGSVAFDLAERINELKADAPPTYEERQILAEARPGE